MTSDEWLEVDRLLADRGWAIREVEESLDFGLEVFPHGMTRGILEGDARMTLVGPRDDEPPIRHLAPVLRRFGYALVNGTGIEEYWPTVGATWSTVSLNLKRIARPPAQDLTPDRCEARFDNLRPDFTQDHPHIPPKE